MTDWFSDHRSIAVILAVLAAVAVGVVVWLYTVPTSSDGLSIGDYGVEKQSEWTQRLAAGLNTHDSNHIVPA